MAVAQNSNPWARTTETPVTASGFPQFQPNASKQSFTSKIAGAAQGLAKGVINPIVTAGTRVAQAITEPSIINKMNTTAAITNQQTASLQSVLDKIKTETDPVKKAALTAYAHQLVDQNTGNQQVAQGATNMEASNGDTNVSLPGLGDTTVAGQQGGAKGVEQIAGQGAQAAAMIYGGEGLGDVAETAGLGGKALLGAKIGGIAGGLGGAGGAMQNAEGGGDVIKQGLEGSAIGAVAGAGTGVLAEGLGNAKGVTGDITPGAGAADSEKVAQDAINNPLSKDEQAIAVKRGRLSDTSKTGVNPKITYEASPQTKAMTGALKPLVESGDIQAPTSAGAQESNILKTGDAISNQGDALRKELENSDAIWNSNELKGRMNDVSVPDPVKNDSVLNKNVGSLKKAVITLAKDADKKPPGLLDLRQNVDSYIQDNYGKNFFDKGRNADPFHQYVYNLRDELNNFAADKLPDGKLSDGTTYKDALLNQHHLINAQDEMTAKFVREYPEGSTKVSRFIAQHPMLRRFGMRTAMQIAAAGTGTALAVSSIKKAVSSLGK
jgi:hypothetical protein